MYSTSLGGDCGGDGAQYLERVRWLCVSGILGAMKDAGGGLVIGGDSGRAGPSK